MKHRAKSSGLFHYIFFKILSVSKRSLLVEISQARNYSEFSLDKEMLIDQCKKVFKGFLPERDLRIKVKLTNHNQPTLVRMDFIQPYMDFLELGVEDIASETGMAKSNLTSWINGDKEMSQAVKSMFYCYFL